MNSTLSVSILLNSTLDTNNLCRLVCKRRLKFMMMVCFCNECSPFNCKIANLIADYLITE